MEYLIQTTLLGLFFGTFGTTLGGIIGIGIKNTSNKFLSFMISLSAGLMISVVCFELIPEAIEIANISNIIFGIILGIMGMIFCDIFVEKKFKKSFNTDRYINTNTKKYTNARNDVNMSQKIELLKTGIIVSIGLAIHNFPEGIAIGSGFEASLKLGYSLAIAICLHDIPEGISMALPMKTGGMKKSRILIYVILSGVTTGLGAMFGCILGGISQQIIAINLAFAAGAMLYIISGELIPESNKLYSGRMTSVGNMVGFLIGLLANFIN